MVKTRLMSGTAVMALLLAIVLISGCSTKAGTGTVAGAGVGALIGQAIGGNTGATLIGAAVGAGAGYLIGNEMDKDAAAEMDKGGGPPPRSPLTGTKWEVVSMVPKSDPPLKSYQIEFVPDGYLHTRKVAMDGKVITDRERYRVVGQTLIINKPGYIINAKYLIDGNQLIMEADDFRAVFKKL